MKKNNKGFIATSILFGIVALLFITFAIILGNSHASLKNDKMYGNMLKAEITNVLGVRLKPNGGTVSKQLLEIDYNGTYGEVDKNGNIQDLPIPTREGYNFDGWFTEQNGGTEVYKNTMYKEKKANILYAHWTKNMYDLTINPNEGLYENSPDINTLPLEYEETKEISLPTRKGYTFVGWELKGTGSKIDGTTFQMGYENAELKAIWERKKIALTVDPNLGTWEGSNDAQSFILEYLGTKEIAEPVRDGYTFAGWEIVEGKATFNGNILTIEDSNVMLKAKWVVKNYKYFVKHYKQAIETDDYTLVDADTDEGEAAFGTTVTPPYKTYDGFHVLGDSEIEGDYESNIKPKSLVISSNINENIVEYQYARMLYVLKINPNGGSYNGDLENRYKYEKRIDLSIPTREGYTFTNWSLTSGKIENNTFIISDTDATITANWKKNKYILTLDTNDGSGKISQKEVEYDSKYGSFEKPSRIGYTFKGWSLTKDGSNIVDENTIVKTAKNHTVYAVWQANQYTVTLKPRNGTVSPTTITVTYDGKYSNLPTPTRSKHQFLGWFTDETAGTQVTTDTKVLITSSQTLYARWLPTDAEFIQYSNSTYTTCTNVACALDELYQMFK